MPDATKVTAAKPAVGGAIYRAPIGTTLPTDTASQLDAAFKALGYVSEDGLTNSNSMTNTDVKAWGGDTVLNIDGGKTDTFAFSLIEVLNEDVLKAVYGSDNVSGTLAAGLTVSANGKQQEAASWVVDMILKGGALKRIVVPNGSITAIGDIVYSDSAATGYEVTVSALPDSSGNTHYEYIKG